MKTLTSQNAQQDYIETETTPSQPLFDSKAMSEHAPEVVVAIATHTTILGRTVAGMILLAFVLLPFAPRIVAFSVILLLHIFAVTTTAKLARSMNKNSRLWATLMIVPLINLFAAIRLTHQAAVVLRRYGIGCNDLGVSRRALQEYGCPDANSSVTTWRSKINP